MQTSGRSSEPSLVSRLSECSCSCTLACHYFISCRCLADDSSCTLAQASRLMRVSHSMHSQWPCNVGLHLTCGLCTQEFLAGIQTSLSRLADSQNSTQHAEALLELQAAAILQRKAIHGLDAPKQQAAARLQRHIEEHNLKIQLREEEVEKHHCSLLVRGQLWITDRLSILVALAGLPLQSHSSKQKYRTGLRWSFHCCQTEV